MGGVAGEGVEEDGAVQLLTATAASLERIALATSRSVPSLIETWIEERLAVIGAPEADPAVDLAVHEVRDRFRDRYRPSYVVILMVGESPPAGDTFFYQADSNLFHATREAFERAWVADAYAPRSWKCSRTRGSGSTTSQRFR